MYQDWNGLLEGQEQKCGWRMDRGNRYMSRFTNDHGRGGGEGNWWGLAQWLLIHFGLHIYPIFYPKKTVHIARKNVCMQKHPK